MAIVGASADPGKRGHHAVAALLNAGFKGDILPVNPRGGGLLGLPVARSIDELPSTPDLAYLALPAAKVPETARALGEAGVRGAVVPAVGFRESGPEGADLEARLVAAAKDTGIRIVGPNTSGLVNTHRRLQLVGGEPHPPGGLAVVSQSGNLALDLMTSASTGPLGISVYVGPGNEADVAIHEYLDFLGDHEPTRAIALYVEGMREGETFAKVARRVSERKPVVALKGGKHDAGRRAALSHTGALAGSYDVFSAVARAAGIVEVRRSDELLTVAEALALQAPAPASVRRRTGGERTVGVVVLSDGGGHATLAADELAANKVPLAALDGRTEEALRALLGPAAAVSNPIDVAGAADREPAVLARAVELIARDAGCAALFVTGLFGGYAIRFSADLAGEELRAARAISASARAGAVPLVVHSLYAARGPAPLRRLIEDGVPVTASLETGLRAVSAVWQRGAPLASPAAPAVLAPKVERRSPADRSAAALSETEARELLAAQGVPFGEAALCADEAAIRALPQHDGRRVLKVVSPHLPHRTEAGAVRLGLDDVDGLLTAFRECRTAAEAFLRRAGLPVEVDGALISPQHPAPIAELIVGARRDPSYGPILTLGLGGTDVELLGDVGLLPLGADGAVSEAEVIDLCRGLRRGPVLFGYRGTARADLAAVTAVARGVARCLSAHVDVAEVEVNPLFVYADGVIAVDASGFRRND
ncbi:MAG: acetate--CoA ligase family protein [Gemmatimonadota bacterium]